MRFSSKPHILIKIVAVIVPEQQRFHVYKML